MQIFQAPLNQYFDPNTHSLHITTVHIKAGTLLHEVSEGPRLSYKCIWHVY